MTVSNNITRRNMLRLSAGVAAGAALGKWATAAEPPKLTPPAEIDERVRSARPLFGGRIPADLPHRLGATHADGRYHLTDKPYLIEGAEALQRLGMRVAKFWFTPGMSSYPFNSRWKWQKGMRLVDLAEHEYFAQAFDMPFTTFVLEVQPVARTKRPFPDAEYDYREDERELHELAVYLLKTYAARNVTFILQHWEGDWMLRGKAGEAWQPGGPADLKPRCEGFTRWLAARQRGVARARDELAMTLAASSTSRCKVYHAAEVNKVLDLTRGVPTLTSHVLPHVAVDLVSWSSYDGMASAVKTWQGIELIRHYARPHPLSGKPRVFIGEVGKPEQGETEQMIVDFWDRAMGVFFAQEIPWIVHWELYCNEPKDGNKDDKRARGADELRGFWLIKPDGSLSHSGKYLTTLLKHSGRALPQELRKG